MTDAELPLRFGLLLFNGYEVLDVFGPVEVLNCLSYMREKYGAVSPSGDKYAPMTMSIITRDGKPVNSGPRAPDPCRALFCGPQSIVATHSFDNCPPLDVLLVPGGRGLNPSVSQFEVDGMLIERSGDDAPEVAFVQNVYPSLKYLITVCTGAGLAARAGILDGHRATTNKRAWKGVTAYGPKTYWVAHARWVESGNIWSTSGVSAGTDGTFAWVKKLYGQEMAASIKNMMEYEGTEDPANDPFAAVNGAEDVPPTD